MRPFSIRDFFSFMLTRKPIVRDYKRMISKQKMIADIADKFSIDDSIYLTKPGPKRFIGGFQQNSDDFSARIRQSIWRYATTIPSLIDIKGIISGDDKQADISLEYCQTDFVLNQKWIIGILNVALILFMIFMIRDLGSLIAVLAFMIIMTGTILITSYNLLDRQIKFTEQFLVFDDDKTTGNKM